MHPSLILASVLMGQVYCQPVAICPPTTIPHTYVEPAVYHHIRNVPGGERSRFYTWIQTPDGYRTKIPVINGYLPDGTVHRSGDRVSSLLLDYSRGHAWKTSMQDKVIQYDPLGTQKRLPRTYPPEEDRRPRTYPDPEPSRTPSPAPVPKLDEPDHSPLPEPQKVPLPTPIPKVGTYGGNTPTERSLPQPKTPASEQSDTTLEMLKRINERLDGIEEKVKTIDDLTSTVNALTNRVGHLGNKVYDMEARQAGENLPSPSVRGAYGDGPAPVESAKLPVSSPPVPKLDVRRSPSDVDSAEPEKTKSLPTYER